VREDVEVVKREYLQHLPAWILLDARERGTQRTYLATLQHMANTGDEDEEGNITKIKGGGRLAARCNINYRTLQRHIKKLLYNDYIVVTWQADACSELGRERFNWYAIPNHRGALDQIAMTPTSVSQILVAEEQDKRGCQKYMPMHVREGAQSRLWIEKPHEPPRDDVPKTGNLSPPPRQVDVPPTTTCRTSLPSPSPSNGKNHGDHDRGACAKKSGTRRKPTKGPWLTDVEIEDLTDNDRLSSLLRRAVSNRIGRFADRDPEEYHTRLQFFGMAEHCLRIGKDPELVFASNVSKDIAFKFISEADDQRAQDRLKPKRRDLNRQSSPPQSKAVHPAVKQQQADAATWSQLTEQHRNLLREQLIEKLGPIRAKLISSGRLSEGHVLVRMARDQGIDVENVNINPKENKNGQSNR